MKKFLLTSIMVILSISSVIANEAKDAKNQHIIDSLSSVLSTFNSPADSIPLLYDILDLSRYDNRATAADQLFNTARRAGSLKVQLDVARRLSTYYGSRPEARKKIEKLINYVASLPLSDEQRITLSFLRVQAKVIDGVNLTESDRKRSIRDLIKANTLNSQSEDPFNRIEFLFIVCRYLQNDMRGEMVTQYIDELGRRLEELPGDITPLRNQYYVQSSLIYTISGLSDKAVDACKKLLETIEQLEQQARNDGNEYRSYDTYRYTAYRRLLTNHKSLSTQEVDSIYSLVKDLAARNTDVREDIQHNQRIEIYYLLAKKQYREALDLLSKQIDNPSNKGFLVRLLPYMIEAAKAVGDNDKVRTAALAYNDILEKMLEIRADERNSEIIILEELRDITGSNTNLLTQQRENELHFHQTLLNVALIAGAVLLIIIAVLLMIYRRTRRLALAAAKANDDLLAERDTLQHTQQELIRTRDHARRADRHKTEFINNMSHEIRTPLNALVECSHILVDNVPDERRRYLQRYADMIDVSADMIRALVSDVLDLASLDNSQMQVNRQQVSADKICKVAVDSMRKHARDGVIMEFIEPANNVVMINTDKRRVEQVLINLLSNSAKFTDEGHIRLTYKVNPENSTLSFIVEDTGIGVPPGKEEIIFERFEKLSNLTPGTGLGLNIARMIAELLKGKVFVDTTYEGPGARFIFTLPI